MHTVGIRIVVYRTVRGHGWGKDELHQVERGLGAAERAALSAWHEVRAQGYGGRLCAGQLPIWMARIGRQRPT